MYIRGRPNIGRMSSKRRNYFSLSLTGDSPLFQVLCTTITFQFCSKKIILISIKYTTNRQDFSKVVRERGDNSLPLVVGGWGAKQN